MRSPGRWATVRPAGLIGAPPPARRSSRLEYGPVSDAPDTQRPAAAELARAVDALVDECRVSCLWYMPADYHPVSDEERWTVLDLIQQHADLPTFKRAGDLKRWLSRPSSSASAVS